MEKHFAEVALGETIRGFRRNKPALKGAQFHAFVVNTAAVVFHFDVNVIAAVVGTKRNLPHFRLASSDAIFGPLDSMGNGIADEVYEGIGNLLNDIVVEFRLASRKVE